MSRTRRACSWVVLVAVIVLWGVARAEPDGADANSHPVLVVQTGHSDCIHAACFSPSGTYVATASGDGTALLWETRTGRQVRRFSGHAGPVQTIAFCSGASHLLTGGEDAAVLWDARTGRQVRRFAVEGHPIESVALSRDDRQVLTIAGLEVHVWDRETGERVFGDVTFPSPVVSASFAPGGENILLMSHGDGTLRLVELSTGKEVRTYQGPPGVLVGSTAFSKDGSRVLIALHDGSVRVWDVEAGRQTRRYDVYSREGVGGEASSAEFSPDGKLILVTGSLRTLRVLDAKTGQVMRRLETEGGAHWDATFSANGEHVLACGVGSDAFVWETASGRLVARLEGRVRRVRNAAFTRDGTCLLTRWDDGSLRWPLLRTAPVRRFPDPQKMLGDESFSPDGKRVLATDPSDGSLFVWELASQRERVRFRALEHGHAFNGSAAFTPDGRGILIAGGVDPIACVCDALDGHVVRRFVGHAGGVTVATMSEDGRRVLTTGADRTVRLWDAHTGEESRELVRSAFGAYRLLAFSPDGRRAATSDGHTTQVWEVETGKEVRRFDPEPGWLTSVRLSRAGHTLLTACSDGAARLWDVDSGRCVRAMDGHTGVLRGTAFSPEGRRVMTYGGDGTVRLWNRASGACLGSLVETSSGVWIAIAPDGRFDASDLEAVEALQWVIPDDPMRPLPVEVYMRDYYEPRLLQRLLAGEVMRPVKDLAALNRAQPMVRIVRVEPDPEDEHSVRVTVEVGSRNHTFTRSNEEVMDQSGVYDLRLFRDGQVVGWRDGDLAVGAEDRQVTFEGIPVAATRNATEVAFSAYAFNGDGVKSRTGKMSYEVEASAETRPRTAYVIAFGVDRFADPTLNLSYAAADASLHAASLDKALSETRAWARVVSLSLTSTADIDCARKEDLRAVLAALAGEGVASEAAKRIPSLVDVEAARPEDLVILAVSTHGLATGDGGFLLLPSDVTTGESGEVVPASCISTDDLTTWLRPVDAGEMVMIVDACQSAASVEREGFKPGPMGSRGFGQLAWNKKMRILAASQASEYALESSRLRHGLLTHALVREGLEGGKADAGGSPDDAITLREWLAYGESRVPELAEAIATGALEAMGPKGPLPGENRPEATRVVQRPALFDFSRAGRKETVVRAGGKRDD